jgi:hypothetical protein
MKHLAGFLVGFFSAAAFSAVSAPTLHQVSYNQPGSIVKVSQKLPAPIFKNDDMILEIGETERVTLWIDADTIKDDVLEDKPVKKVVTMIIFKNPIKMSDGKTILFMHRFDLINCSSKEVINIHNMAMVDFDEMYGEEDGQGRASAASGTLMATEVDAVCTITPEQIKKFKEAP